MALSTWLSLKRAEAAVRAGLLTEARRLLNDPRVATHRRGVRLRARLAEAAAREARRCLGRGDCLAAARALALGPKAHPLMQRVRDEVADRLREHVRQSLASGDPAGAVRMAAHTGSPGPELLSLARAARQWCQARRWAEAGRFDVADRYLELAGMVDAPGAALQHERARLLDRASQYEQSRKRMHRALSTGDWPVVAEASEGVLALAPGSAEARHLQRLAQERWIMSQSAPTSQPPDSDSTPRGRLRPVRPEDAARGILWIDGAGGYLVLTGEQVRLGQGGGADGPDIPVRADLSRCHATITRHEEAYRLVAHKACTRNGQSVCETLLVEGDRLVLGQGTVMRFDVPVPGSGTAVVRFDDPRRLPWPTDGVVLLADTLVVGAGPSAHVPVPHAEAPVAVFRRDGRWWARVVGQGTDAQADELVPGQARELEGMRLTLEAVSTD